jgi:hypothetical protein
MSARIPTPQKPVTWRDVLRCLPDDQTRSYALSRFRESRFDADSFATRIAARAALADALTATEDFLEVEHPRREGDRLAIRDVRRRLETEVWP